MDAVSATIVGGGQAWFLEHMEVARNKLIFPLMILLKPLHEGLRQPLPRRIPGVQFIRP